MVSQITRGIKITVKVKHLGSKKHLSNLVNIFNYEISIENHSNDVVQLLRRSWLIKDSLNHNEVVEGEGVIGKKPIVNPNETFHYESGSFIRGYAGSMQGFFTMVNFSTSQIFHVKIPLFNLNVPYLFN
ncbi:Co2+/Mg2+ efflux protein ApaG [Flavobacterium sp. xlx-214]|uniref:Co2+/Mg2+ efflux protein ApaG n=1 Tax=unclassified Flavobacterium TaxID=196869 RepID=UPI0013D5E36F|nr:MULTISPECIES: Co2+/Mg2+ efflux protein ApaG [unclassified Flavobacterium]MBA5792309.1 Co2+/Mg2+ efflux protein ApaG [Flavobacterium sp. xlx-221]QMI82374.1 Co2+/Mg2+ efflux protein ApaG [Flavobacterium sp. xlx-214]